MARENGIIAGLLLVMMVAGMFVLTTITTITPEMKILFALVLFIFTMFVFGMMAFKKR